MMNRKMEVLCLVAIPVVLFAALMFLFKARQNRFIVLNKTGQTITKLRVNIEHDSHTLTNIPNGARVWFEYRLLSSESYFAYSYEGETANGGRLSVNAAETGKSGLQYFGRRDTIVLSPNSIWQPK